jgi:hypothetical protein
MSDGAEVREFQNPVIGEHEVLGSDVAVDQPEGVNMRNTLQDFAQPFQCRALVGVASERSGRHRLLGQSREKNLIFRPVCLIHIGNDVLMLRLTQMPDLSLKAKLEVGEIEAFGDRHFAAKRFPA